MDAAGHTRLHDKQHDQGRIPTPPPQHTPLVSHVTHTALQFMEIKIACLFRERLTKEAVNQYVLTSFPQYIFVTV